MKEIWKIKMMFVQKFMNDIALTALFRCHSTGFSEWIVWKRHVLLSYDGVYKGRSICWEQKKSQTGIWFSDFWGHLKICSPWSHSSISTLKINSKIICHFAKKILIHPRVYILSPSIFVSLISKKINAHKAPLKCFLLNRCVYTFVWLGIDRNWIFILSFFGGAADFEFLQSKLISFIIYALSLACAWQYVTFCWCLYCCIATVLMVYFTLISWVWWITIISLTALWCFVLSTRARLSIMLKVY